MFARPFAAMFLLLAIALPAPAARAEARAEDVDTSPSGGSCADKAVNAIQRRYRETRDLRATFRQATRSVAFGRAGSTSDSTGTVQFAKPGKMRWSYEEPNPSLLVSDGSVMWIYDPVRGEAQRLSLAGGGGYFSGAGVRFLLGAGDIREEFRVTRDDCTGTDWELELVPRRETTFEKLRVRVDRQTGDLVRTRIVDLIGNETTIDFSDIEVNQSPDDSTFEFDPPAGVEIIDLASPNSR